MSSCIVKFACPDRVGVLSEVSSVFSRNGCNLTEVNQYTDLEAGWFFARFEFDYHLPPPPEFCVVSAELGALAEKLGAEWTIKSKARRYRLAILCSKDGHCLADLLWRWRSGSLPFDLVGVVSNHSYLSEVVEREGVPFSLVPVGSDKDSSFVSVRDTVEGWGAEVIVLARYMQVVPSWLCREWENRAINIHHSFLPAFPGASPYLQAFRKGVKIIGATCHYVTPELDEGPIIEQEVLRVSHSHGPEDLVRAGQDCERLALSRGLLYHLEDRVFCHRGKTVVFSG